MVNDAHSNISKVSLSLTFRSYLQFSAIASAAVRQCLKADAAVVADKRLESTLKIKNWEGGKQVGSASTYTHQIFLMSYLFHFAEEVELISPPLFFLSK